MKNLLSILVVIMYGNIVSQTLQDTIKIQEVEITAKRALKEIAKSSQKIDSLVISETINESMAELLSEHSPVFIKQAGRGALATVSFRGTSASHTDVLWNDISIKSPMLGQVDFSLLPMYFIDDIELFSGGSSIEKSNGALGGAITINNKADWNNENSLRFIQGIGSFTSINDFLQFNIGKKQFKSKTRLFYNYSKNNFKFKNKNTADINPETGEYIYNIQQNENADYTKYGVLQEFYFRTKKDLNFSLKYWGQFSDRNLPRLNTFEGDDYSNINNQKDLSHRVNLKTVYFINKLKISYISAFTYQSMDYSQSNFISGLGYQNVVFSKSWNRSFYNKLKFKYKINNNTELNFNTDFNNDYVSSQDTVKHQAYIKTRNEFVLFASLNKQITDRFGVSLMIKKYYASNQKIPISPFAGIDYLLSKKLSIRTKLNISKNYKNPDLNDLYWQPGGNPHLKPEENTSLDFSVETEQKIKNIQVFGKISTYYSDVENWIIWIPTPMGYWTPKNIKSVISKGVELNMKLVFNIKKIKITGIGNYAYTNAKNYGEVNIWGDDSYAKQLPYIPLHSVNFLLSVEKNRYKITYTNNSYSERYTTSSNNISLRDWLYPYYMNNLALSKIFILKNKYRFGINFKIYNFFNEEYRSVLGRPMPRINYMLNLSFEM